MREPLSKKIAAFVLARAVNQPVVVFLTAKKVSGLTAKTSRLLTHSLQLRIGLVLIFRLPNGTLNQ